MNDTQVFIILKGIIDAALTAAGFTDVVVAQNYQPTQQGVPEGRVIYIHKLPSVRYGHPHEENAYNDGNSNFDTTHSFIRLNAFQVNARAQQDPNDLNSMTASDLLQFVADTLQLPSTRETLLSDNIGIERITEERVIFEANEKERFEQVPSFDFTLNYKREYTSTTAAVTQFESNVRNV